MVVKIDEPSSVPIADLDKSYKKQNEQIIFGRYLARTPSNDIYMLEPTQGVPQISVGSVIEFAGTLYQVITEPLTITGSVSDGDVYIKLYVEGETLKASITNSKPPAFDFVKKGYYTIENEVLVKYLAVKLFRKEGKYTSIDEYKVISTTPRIDMYPIGIIIEFSNDANPNILFPNTTWVEYGLGRVTVAKSSDTEFNAVGKTGGAKTHTLTIEEMPKHNHEVPTYSFSGYGEGLISRNDSKGQSYTEDSGGSQPHNNIQPYITVRRWTRIA